MIDELKISGVENSNSVTYGNLNALNSENLENVSIFDDSVNEESVAYLYEQLDAVEDKQGIFSKGWNNFKETFGIGTSHDKCEAVIDSYTKGEISFEEASEKIDEYNNKQDSSLNLFANIATSIVAIAAVALVTVATGGTALPVIATVAIGAGAGAATKMGFKATDRATNKLEGDALEGKQLLKDGLSGAVTGGIAVYTAGTGAKVFSAAGNGAKLSTHVANGAIKSAKTGLKTGAISGSSNYAIDCAFDDDKNFSAKEMARVTAESTLVGGAVGLTMGGLNGALRHSGVLQAADSNVATNSASTASYKILNDRIKAVA